MAQQDRNPFSEPGELDNPFQDPAVTEHKPSTQYATLDVYNPFDNRGIPTPYQPSTGMPATQPVMNLPYPGATVPQPTAPSTQTSKKMSPTEPKNYGSYGSQTSAQAATAAVTTDLLRQQEELNRKAEELDRRERELRNVALASSTTRPNNWPPLPAFCPVKPCFYQDIALEIPQECQKTMSTMYYLWMFSTVTLFLNFLACLSWFFVDQNVGSSFGLSILWVLLFTPCSFLCWYKPLYKAIRSDSSFNFFTFFFIFFVQDIVYVMQAIGISGWGFSGWIAALSVLNTSKAVAIIMMIVSMMFTATAVLGIVMLKKLALSGLIGVVSWKRPFTLMITFFTLLSALCVMLSLAGSILSCQNAQLVKSLDRCQRVTTSYTQYSRIHKDGFLQDWCECCHTQSEQPLHASCPNDEETITMYLNPECKSLQAALKDLLFSVCGLTILSTIICTLSAVICCIQIFSLDIIHVLVPQRSTSVNLECISPQETFLHSIMDFEEFVPPVPPPPYYPPEYTCSSETDAQSITYNGSMDSPVPLYPTDFPPSYESVMGLRGDSQATLFEAPTNDVSHLSPCNGVSSTVVSGEVSMDSASLVMSEIVDIPDDSSPSEDSCLLDLQGSVRSVDFVLFRSIQRSRADYCLSVDCVQSGHHQHSPSFSLQGPFEEIPVPRVRGERSYSCSTPGERYDALPQGGGAVTHSCNRLESIAQSAGPCFPEVRVKGKNSAEAARNRGAACPHHGASCQAAQCPQRRYSEFSQPRVPARVVTPRPLPKSHSDPGISSAHESGFQDVLYTKGLEDEATNFSTDTALSSEAGMSRHSRDGSRHLLRTCSVGKSRLQVTKEAVQRLSQSGALSLGDLKVCRGTRVLVTRFLQRSKRNLAAAAAEHAGNGSLCQKQVLLHEPGQEGIHLRSCGDLSSTSPLRRLLSGGRLERGSRPRSLNAAYKESMV